MKSIYILGNGQLGRMLYQAAKKLDITVFLVDYYDCLDQLSIDNSIITAEIEHWPETKTTNILSYHPNFINRKVFSILVDRLTQKQLLKELNLSFIPWKLLTNKDEWPSILNALGKSVIVKLRIGGYNGRGQLKIDNNNTDIFPNELYGKCIVEQFIQFSSEISLIGARSYSGKTIFYPISYNLHQNGILYASITFSKYDNIIQYKAEQMLSIIMHKLKYVGVMAMECFITLDDQLIINELSPRVHNSGHWTQNGASINQFELHVRAISGLTLPEPTIFATSVMINLIGIPINPEWIKLPLVNLYWYDKTVRTGRKVGHLNLTNNSSTYLSNTLMSLILLLPEEYTNSINWIIEKLSISI